MMRHPMHIHQHWFILRNGHGEYDPLLHTIEVPPGATAVADVDSDASGNAFFHCHHLFHMVAGMSRVFQYSSIIQIVNGEMQPQKYVANTGYYNRPIIREDEVMPIDPHLVEHPHGHHAGFYFANFLDIGADPFNNAQRLTFKGLYGLDYHKLELFINDAEMKKGSVENFDMDIFYWHPISQFWAIKGGANLYYRPPFECNEKEQSNSNHEQQNNNSCRLAQHSKTYWQPGIGLEGLLPYFIATDIRTYYHSGSAKFDIELSRDTQITNNFFIRAGVRSILATKTVFNDEIGSGLNQMRYIIRPYYRLAPGWALFAEYEHEDAYGAFKNIRRAEGESPSENTITFGITLLF